MIVLGDVLAAHVVELRGRGEIGEGWADHRTGCCCTVFRDFIKNDKMDWTVSNKKKRLATGSTPHFSNSCLELRQASSGSRGSGGSCGGTGGGTGGGGSLGPQWRSWLARTSSSSVSHQSSRRPWFTLVSEYVSK